MASGFSGSLLTTLVKDMARMFGGTSDADRQRFLAKAEAIEAKRRLRQTAADPPPLHGSARLAGWEDLKQARLLHDVDEALATQPCSLYFGPFINPDPELRKRPDNYLFWNGEAHVLTVAPTRSGKGTTQIIPNLLMYQGSAVVLDPKGELWETTSRHRARLGEVYQINPFGALTHAINPLDTICEITGARTLAEMLMPRRATAEGQFHENEAVNLLAPVILHVATSPRFSERTINTVRDLLSLPEPDFVDAMRAMAAEDSPHVAIRRGAEAFLGMTTTGRKTVRRSIHSETALWDADGLIASVSRSDFDFDDLKRRPITVYLSVPFDKMAVYATYLQVLLSAAIDGLARDPRPGPVPVLVVLDEFLQLGTQEKIVNALTTHAGSGVRFWLFIQNLPKLEQLYPTAWKAFLSECEVKCFIGMNDPTTAELISNWMGDHTVGYVSASISSGLNVTGDDGTVSNQAGQGSTTVLTGRRLATATEVSEALGRSEADGTRMGLLFFRGVPPVRTIQRPWSLSEMLVYRAGAHDPDFRTDPDLLELWGELNADAFGGRLQAPAAIRWENLAEWVRNQPIAGCYNHAFREIWLSTAHLPAGPELTDAEYQKILGLLVHEMLHQAVCEIDGAPAAGHNELFRAWAERVADSLVGSMLPPLDSVELAYWPVFSGPLRIAGQ